MKVRTTIAPHEVLDVDEAEYLDLQRQGLLLPDPAEEQYRIAEGAAAGAKPRTKTDSKEG